MMGWRELGRPDGVWSEYCRGLAPHNNQPGRQPYSFFFFVFHFSQVSFFCFQVSCSFLKVAGSDGACNGDLSNLILDVKELDRGAKMVCMWKGPNRKVIVKMACISLMIVGLTTVRKPKAKHAV